MERMISIQEHRPVDPKLLEGLDAGELMRRINYDSSCFDASRINLLRYEFDPRKGAGEFKAYFRIGAEWLDREQTRPLIVLPKMPNIDFIEMFTSCLRDAESADNFSRIYSIDFNARPIRSRALSSILSPLLIVQFLMVMRKVVSHGLRKGYVPRSENLSKVKGRLDIRRNERLNVISGHRERVFCHYMEYSADTLENRLLKHALQISRDMISLMRDHESYATLSAMCNHCLSVFGEVADTRSRVIPNVKHNKLYREYADAIRFALMILRRQDIAVTHRDSADSDLVPVFRIDMALLFEHYTLSLLRRRFGQEAVKYQEKGYGRRFYPDFLISRGDFRVIADTKYHDEASGNVAIPDYIRQLCGYARDTTLLKALGYNVSPPYTDPLPVIPCVLLYPAYSSSLPPLTPGNLLRKSVNGIVRFHTCPVPIPTI